MSLTLRRDINRKLSISEIDNNFIFLQDLNTDNNTLFIDPSYNNTTLSSTASVFFVNTPFSYTTVTLPDASIMIGKELKFINTQNNYEASFNISGPYFDESSTYNLNGFGHTLVIISDGSVWWILSQYTP